MVCTSGGTKSRRAKDFFLSLLDDVVILLLVGGMVGWNIKSRIKHLLLAERGWERYCLMHLSLRVNHFHFWIITLCWSSSIMLLALKLLVVTSTCLSTTRSTHMPRKDQRKERRLSHKTFTLPRPPPSSHTFVLCRRDVDRRLLTITTLDIHITLQWTSLCICNHEQHRWYGIVGRLMCFLRHRRNWWRQIKEVCM